MKQLVTTGTGIRVSFHFIWAVILIWTCLPELKGQGCIMSCPPNDPPVQIGLPSSCTDILTYDEIGVVLQSCAGPISVDIIVNGNSIGDVIDSSMIGGTFMVIVTDDNSGQSCMTMIKVVDKQAPLLVCPPAVTLDCTTDLSTYSALDSTNISDCSSTQIFIEDSLIF